MIATPGSPPLPSPFLDEDVPDLDPRIARSREAIGKALMGLLAEGRPFNEISVSEVASRAGLTRKTFYAHFGSTEAVARTLATRLFKATLAKIGDEAYLLPMSKGGFLGAAFVELHRQIDTLEPLATLCPTNLFLEPAREVVESILFERVRAINHLGAIPDFDRVFLTHLISTTLHGALTAWASRGFVDPPEAVATFVMELIGPVADRVFESAARGR